MTQVYYGVRREGKHYYPWVDGIQDTTRVYANFSSALGFARHEAWFKSPGARLECYQGDNAEHYEKARHFEIFDEYRRRVG